MINSADEFIQLRTSSKPSECLRAASDKAPVEVWHEIIDRHPHMRSWVAHNKTVPAEIVAILACDQDSDVRLSVAMKNRLSSELMRQLASDEDESVRRQIVRNKNTPTEVLQILAADTLSDIAEVAPKRLVTAGILPGA
jgi:hypothetical protein